MRLLLMLLSVSPPCFKHPASKRCFLLVVGLCSLTLSGGAQTLNGNHLVGMQVGEVGFSFRDLRGPIINLSPAYGKFIKPNLALGVELPFYYSYSNGNQVSRRLTHIALTPFVRYYIGEGWVKPFVSLLAGPRYVARRQYGPATATTRFESYTDLLYGARGGVAFFMNRWVSLDLSLSYVGAKHKSMIDSHLGNNALGYDESNGLTVNVGFQVYLGKSKRYQ